VGAWVLGGKCGSDVAPAPDRVRDASDYTDMRRTHGHTERRSDHNPDMRQTYYMWRWRISEEDTSERASNIIRCIDPYAYACPHRSRK